MKDHPSLEDLQRHHRMALAYMQKLLALQSRQRLLFNGWNILDEIRITAGLLHDYNILINRKKNEAH